MNEKIERYRQAAVKAVEFQLQHQQPDGGYIWEGYARDAYHKQAYSWSMSGCFGPAHRLLNWVKAHTLQPDGQLQDYQGDVYKHAWFFQGAHRLGRFDLSYPVLSFLALCQAPCGGFPHFAGDELVRSLSTAWTGIAALYLGRMDLAEKAAQCSIRMLEQQPDEARFYFRMTRDGQLVTAADDPHALCVDTAQPKQDYWEVGLPMMLMGRMYQTTGDRDYLDYARQFFEFKLRCYEDNYSFVGSGKSSLAAAVYYLLTDDERAREAACRFADFLVATQRPEGGWRDAEYGEPDIPLIYIDHAAEFSVWLQEIAAILISKGGMRDEG
jgi:hypothetical protein